MHAMVNETRLWARAEAWAAANDVSPAALADLANAEGIDFATAVWFVVTFVVSYFARELSFNFFGWPFSFYMAAQGSLFVYLLIVWFYARHLNALDHEYGVDEEPEE